jgi:hypothetical protein
MQTADLIRYSLVLSGIWGILNAAQWLFDLRSWYVGGALGWDLHRLRRSKLLRSKLAAAVFSPSGLRVIAASQFVASIALMLSGPSGAVMGWLLCFGFTTMLLAMRGGTDGADKIILVTVVGLALQILGNVFDIRELLLAGILWTGGQLTIAYFASGASKVLLPQWRSGQALAAALSSHTSGSPWSAALVARPGMARALAWAIMTVELLFPLALFLPTPVLLAVLAGFFLFHMAIAAVMGLNTYPWAFVAAYPSVIMMNMWLGS